MESTESKPAIAGPPFHPAVVSFPIAFLVGAVVTDLVYGRTGDRFGGQASYWLLVAGLATGALAALLGLIEFVSIARVRRLPAGWIHPIGNVAVLILALGRLMQRRADPRGADWAPGFGALPDHRRTAGGDRLAGRRAFVPPQARGDRRMSGVAGTTTTPRADYAHVEVPG